MRQLAPRRMTVQEFMRFKGIPGVRYQLIRGVPVAMNPPMSFHRTIVANATGEFRARLRRRRPCRVENEAGIEIANDDYFVADLAVTCGPIINQGFTPDPLLIVEVLSPSTEQEVLGMKVPAYEAIASVREIWLIDSEQRRVRLLRREAADRWVQDPFTGGDAVPSEVLKSSVALDDLYENTGL